MNAAPQFSTEKYERFSPKQYNDKWCAILFVVHMVIVVFSIDFSGGAAKFVAWERAGEENVIALAGLKKVESVGWLSGMDLFGGALQMTSLPGFVLTALLLALILSAIWLLAIKFFPKKMTYFSLWCAAVLCFALCAYSGSRGRWFECILFLMGGLFIVWMCLYDKRVEFTAGLVEQVSTLLLNRPELYAVVFATVVIKVVWMVVCIGSLMGKNALFFLVLLFCFFWSCEVFSNVIHITASGTVSRWFHNEDTEKPLQHAYTHALTYQFGSICLGSSIVAILQTLQWIARQLEEDSDNAVSAILACAAHCILNCIESWVRMFNYWAFCVISIWSPSLRDAGGIVFEFMEDPSDFMQAISSVCCIEIVTMMANIVVGLLDAIICVSLAFGAGTETETIYLYGVIAFVLGYMVNSVGGRIIEAGVGGIFTCATADRRVMKERCKEINDLFTEHFPCQFQRPRRYGVGG